MMHTIFTPVFTGFCLGASAIIAIGAQNVFILRQGLKREHVLPIILLCAGVDAVMITLSVLGVGHVVQTVPYLTTALTYGGAAFLLWQGLQALRHMMSHNHLTLEDQPPQSLKKVMMMTCGFTLLNPHLYLDTVLLMGSVSLTQPEASRPYFGLGAIMASFVWFPLLGYGAAILKPIFSNPLSWRILDGLTALIMLTLAGTLIYHAALPNP
ncbi:MAG: LysE/ArgO family amino acid transporter [Bifidobacteriales bacterium]|uniref:LysE/ArgO family amino acid transporter n=1 Tax=Bombella sp. ESL0385 TaxID=2676446 RepID=UPI001E3359CE|nr:LysE/ArgO family amino acid transporter [Bombella sp. ESL0385]MCT6836759.1 LysE/ArgO family amino acid transporter [Bifidobacteriales bacterium]